MNYAELVQQVKDYLETDETTFNANIDNFIILAEEDIQNRVQVPSMRQNDDALDIAEGEEDVPLPEYFLSVNDLSVTSGTTRSPLIRKDLTYLLEAYPSTTSEGLPKYYAIVDDEYIRVAPKADADYVLNLNYMGWEDSIVDAEATWIGNNAEAALMWGTVLQGYMFLKGSPDLMAAYKAAYDMAISNLQTLVDGFQKKDEYRHGLRRIPA